MDTVPDYLPSAAVIDKPDSSWLAQVDQFLAHISSRWIRRPGRVSADTGTPRR